MAAEGFRLGVDFGTSSTVAALRSPDGRIRPLLFDASPLLSSAVYAGSELLTGADAERAGFVDPGGLEPNPKQRIDDGTVLLGTRGIPVVDLIAAVLGRVAEEARRVAGEPLTDVVLTHPASWRRARLNLLTEAAERAGLGHVGFVPEPVAAATYFADVLGQRTAPGRCLVIYDLGAGTFDVSVVRSESSAPEVVATAGLPNLGGLDLDALVVAHARALTGENTDEWERLDRPQTRADQHARNTLWRGARAAKEQLSRHSMADVHVPLVESTLHLTREEFEKLALPHLERTTALTSRVLRDAGIPPDDVSGVFLVGGSSRIPLASTLLHRTLEIAPTALDQPELVVAEGSLHASRHASGHASGHATPHASGHPKPHAASVRTETPDVLDTAETLETPPRWRLPRPAWIAATAAILVIAVAAVLLRGMLPGGSGGAITGAKFLDTLDGKTTGGDQPIRSIAFSPDSTMLLTGGDTRVPQLWDLEARDVTVEFSTGYQVAVSDVAFSPDGKTIAFVGGPLKLWDVANNEQRAGDVGYEQTFGVTAVAFSPTEPLLATSGNDGDVLFWNTTTGALIGERLEVYQNGDVTHVAFSPDGKLLATAGGDGAIRFWDVRTRKPVGAALTGHDGDVNSLAFTSTGGTLVSGGEDGTIRFWNVADREPIGEPLTGHDGPVFEVAFHRDVRTVASAGKDGTVRLWDFIDREQIGEPLTGHESDVYDVAFSPDGKYLASAGKDRTTRLWELQS
ncbi:Hsp70 family protein [Cryptosporangium aurantiacum]|uniref:Hsp70 family protein n=1 Tax=Cryptosporangium aurantiacum TaxID=134849 RepID=UPI0009340D52|nr:Hsp70 family protein [Cryptosporangium aurantiacum]